MAQHTRHPASPAPSAPVRETTRHLMLRAYIVLTLFATLAHTAVYNLLGPIGAVILLAVLTAGVLAIGVPALARSRPTRFPWRRLPWVAVGYTALALVSVLWSRWPSATLLTWALLAAMTLNALFIATMLTWQEILRALASALKWVLALSLLIELWVALVLRHPLLPNFAPVPEGKIDPHLYWVRGNLLDSGRIQGLVGNAHTLSMMCVLALLVFTVLWAARVRRRGALIGWSLLAIVLLVKAGSPTAYLSLAAALAVMVLALLMRRTTDPSRRTRLYLLAAATAVVGLVAVLLLRVPLLAAIGKDAGLTGRSGIWAQVWERAITRPFAGNGFSSPWVPWVPGFDGWIMDHGLSVFHAHSMWLDVFFQLGAAGLLLMAIAWLALSWRSWFFAVDRPRWDLDAHRPFSPVSLLPVMITAALLVEGLAESAPIMLWGWLLLVLFSFKIKTVPLVGVGLDERSRVLEHGEPARLVP